MTPPSLQVPVLIMWVWTRNGIPVYASPDSTFVLKRVLQKLDDMQLSRKEVEVKDSPTDRTLIAPKLITHPELSERWLIHCVEAD